MGLSGFYDRLLMVKGDAAQQVVDLLLFLGYFSICLYAGGIAYASAYNEHFHLVIKAAGVDPGTAVTFVTQVLATGWYFVASVVAVPAFIFVYYACRYVFRPWFGFLLLSSVLYGTFIVCGIVGQMKGRADAQADMLKDSTSRPTIKLYGEKPEINKYRSGGYHLLAENETSFFVFEPPSVQGSVVQIDAVPKAMIDNYEVTVR